MAESHGDNVGFSSAGASVSPTVNVFVTGQPGIGKTTLVLNVAKQLPADVIAGFYTVEARAEGTGEKLGLDVETFSGERSPLCRLRRGCGPKVGKFYVAIQDFERIVLPHITPSKKIKLHIIDEIGRMELSSDRFKEAIEKLLDSPRAVFGALPAPRYGHTLEQVEKIKQRPDTAVLTLTKANREATTQQVVDLLQRLIREAQEHDRMEEEAAAIAAHRVPVATTVAPVGGEAAAIRQAVPLLQQTPPQQQTHQLHPLPPVLQQRGPEMEQHHYHHLQQQQQLQQKKKKQEQQPQEDQLQHQHHQQLQQTMQQYDREQQEAALTTVAVGIQRSGQSGSVSSNVGQQGTKPLSGEETGDDTLHVLENALKQAANAILGD